MSAPFAGGCPCGGRLFGGSSGYADSIRIMAGGLDDPGRFAPAMEIISESAQPWAHRDPAPPKSPRAPEVQ